MPRIRGGIDYEQLPAVEVALRELDIKPFAKHPENPVLDLGASGGWDDDDVEVSCAIRGEDGKFWLYYHGSSKAAGFRIGLAYSDDLVSWTREADNPILTNGTTGAWDEEAVAGAHVVKVGDTYHMYFNGRNTSKKVRIGHATSSDGKSWTKDSANPIIEVEGNAYVNWVLYREDLREFWLSVNGQDIYTSTDGTNFSKKWDNVVINSPYQGAWNSEALRFNSIIKLGGLWLALVKGCGLDGKNMQGLCVSLDCVNWVEYPGNPMLWGEYASWEAGDEGTKIGSLLTWNGKLYIFYTGEDASVSGRNRIGLAVSKIGKAVESDYFRNDARGAWNNVSIDADETTYGVPTLGYKHICAYFISDTSGDLELQVQEPDESWWTYTTKSSIATNELVEIIPTGKFRGIRLRFSAAATVTAFYELRE